MTAVGPTNPDDGFPTWYKDSNGLNLGQCLDVTNPLCNLAASGVDTTKPVSFPTNYPDEAFYQLANSTIALPNGTTAVLDNNLEAAFGSGAPQAGQQITFGRVRIRITTPTTGHYVVTHPYGVDEFDVTDAATRNINFTEDVGIGAPGDFTGALGSRINPFLRWDTGLITGPDGASYTGDAVTPHKITGSELGTNFFRIDGPDIGGTGINTIQSDLFTVQGRVATNNGVAPTAVTYTRTATTGGFIDAFAKSDPNQVIQVTGTGVSSTTLQSDPQGNYFGRVAFTGEPPASVNVTNTSDRPPTTVKVTLTDQVTLTKVTYDISTKSVKVAATSSDTAVPPTLTVVGYGTNLVAGNATFQLGAEQQPPATITVSSSKGGTDSAPVSVTGAALPADNVVAQAPATLTVQQGQLVTLDGSTSLNATGYSWAQVAGDPAVTLTNANTAKATFTAPSTATTLTFRLTVQGPGGPQTTDTVVTVEAVAPPVANAGPAQTVLIGDTVTLDGSASTGATSYSWSQVGGTPVTLSGTTAVKPTFKMPSTNNPLTFQLTVTGPGGSDVASVQINPKADVLTTTRVEYRTSTGEWRVEGTSQVLTGNTITVHIGTTLSGPVLGTASPDALGAWSVRLPGPPPDGSRKVSIESTRGGALLGVAVNVRA